MPGQNNNSKSNGRSLDIACAKLVEMIARWAEKDSTTPTAIPALAFHRRDEPTEPISYMHEPSICLVAQGSKRVLLGEDVYVYDAHHFLITSVGLPVVAQILEATSEKPYLGLTLQIDQRMISQMMADSDLPQPRISKTDRGMDVGDLVPPLQSAFLRLLELLDQPDDIPILAPLVQREIMYRLLVGDQGPRLRQIGVAGSHGQQIARAIDWLKENYTQPLRVDDLATNSSMSTSTFHHHFRAMTAMSPLQYQKWLRLNEARRLMLTERLDAATASFQVGYESPSQFNREYKRQFGAPPLRDIKNLNQNGLRLRQNSA